MGRAARHVSGGGPKRLSLDGHQPDRGDFRGWRDTLLAAPATVRITLLGRPADELDTSARDGRVNGLSAPSARIVRGRVMTGFTAASSVLVNAVERLCDHDLGEVEREYSTDQLCGAVADVRLALAELGELVGVGEHAAEGVVLRVSRARFRRHGWGRRL